MWAVTLTREVDGAGHADLESAGEVLEEGRLLVYLRVLDSEVPLALLVLLGVLPRENNRQGLRAGHSLHEEAQQVQQWHREIAYTGPLPAHQTIHRGAIIIPECHLPDSQGTNAIRSNHGRSTDG